MYKRKLIRALVLGGFFLFFGIKFFYSEYSAKKKFNQNHKKIEGIITDIQTTTIQFSQGSPVITEYEQVQLTLQDSSKYRNTSNNIFSAAKLSNSQPVTIWVHHADTEPIKTIRQLEANNTLITKAKLNIISIPWLKYLLVIAGLIGLIAGFISISKPQQ